MNIKFYILEDIIIINYIFKQWKMKFKKHIIIDNGSGCCKAGFNEEEMPKVIPSYIGYPLFNEKNEFFIGEEAEAIRDKLKLNYPIEQGVVKNWDEMEKIWSHIFINVLKVDPVEHNIMISDAIMNPTNHRQKMGEIMFENFNIPGLYIAFSPVLSLYNVGKFTGIVVESGEGVTQIAPYLEGLPINNALIRLDFGGRDLTEYMIRLLIETGNFFSTSNEKEIVRTIKEKACYTALDFEDELKAIEPFDYELPDEKHVVVKDQRIRCSEALFKPSMIGKEFKGIAESCYNSIEKCKVDIRKDFYNTIILSGGSTLFNGLPERFTKEIKALASESMKEEVRIIASPQREFGTWFGGSILSSISTFDSLWITKSEYEESGPDIILKKCN